METTTLGGIGDLPGDRPSGEPLAGFGAEVTSLLEAMNPEETVPVAQVTAVSQLSDVRSTDWAFTALQSLVERYGCVAGYPDRTFRGAAGIESVRVCGGGQRLPEQNQRTGDRWLGG
ncbi:MAG: S-layer homology domain-containing protein [Oscillatoriales cyanobacterium SM2_1_8]|nr:S-layer homology domain-containing protein [Oscillatoriales cyanobacterium SM2_1_8]